ncbi:GntR family transcriptional regulator [Paenibacillus eucommiae]|uniref:DNA-binding GntR family transcriptional regulator n=1 Tax=Paenibacillus eucommiae TaxID=1355755 RepID=A0ABS4IPF1_9BACL|nr:GntR family transcriptional regulator [Paenibacillus eucommiae]MBP1989432.1 DNA-binding GntR family transcriptional regulator [Paenibacillus eucommiae]
MMSDFRFEEQKMTSLRHKITDDIRKAIFQGKLKPGDRLREVDMAKQMGVSRGPIREAMRMLEQEGVINSQPYKETMVAEISAEEVMEVLVPIRLTIELFAIRKALPNIQEPQIERLTQIIADMKEGAAQKDLHKIVDCDLAFHEYLVTLSNVPNLLGIWTTIFNRIRLHFIVQGQTYEDFNDLWHNHELLLAKIKEGNLAEIYEELTRHIEDFNSGFLEDK